MELIFVWVKNHNFFENIGINFNPSFRFSYDNTKQILRIEKNNLVVENIFGDKQTTNIHNITAIVGNNGAGKTTLLEIIFKNFVCNKTNMVDHVLGIFREKKKFYLYSSLKTDTDDYVKISTRSEEGNELFEMKNEYIKNEYEESEKTNLDSIKYIYYSNVYESRYYTYKKYGTIRDISTIGMLMEQYDKKQDMAEWCSGIMKDRNLSYFYNEFSNQISFVTNYQNFKNYVPFKLPYNVYVKFSDISNDINEIESRTNVDEVREILELMFEENETRERSDEGYFLKSIIARSFYLLMVDFANEPAKEYVKKKVCMCLKESCKKLKSINWENGDCYLKFLNDLKSDLKKKNLTQNVFIDSHISFIQWTKANINIIGNLESIRSHSFIVPTRKDTGLVGIMDFFEKYQAIAGVKQIFDFSWGLSTGENTLLSMFSRFYLTANRASGKIIKNQYEDKNVIILIDEIDLSLHPEWQQKILNYFLKFISDLYSDSSIQIIFTTHSPIILSDIPKSNVVFMNKNSNGLIIEDSEKHKETFAANISTLFYDSFFMDKGSIGDFAKNKINSIITALRPTYKNDSKSPAECIYPDIEDVLTQLGIASKEQLETMINSVGEPLLRNKLFDMMDMCLYKNTGTSYYKQRLQKQIERKQEELKRLENNNDKNNC